MSKYIDPRGKLFGHLDRIAQMQAGHNPAPVNVEIDLTNRCNLGCDACHFAHVHSRGPLASRRTHDSGDMFDYPLIDNVLQQLWAAGVRSVTWTGGGEPTTHKFFDAVVDDCPLPQGIYTNGTLIDEQRADLLKRRMEWVYVSLDCHTRESYKVYKKVDAFDRACRGVELMAMCGKGATVGVGYLLDAHNWRDAEAMTRHGLSLGADYVNFRPMIDFDPAHPDRATDGREWINAALPVLREIGEIEGVIVDTERFEMYRDWQGHAYKRCWWAQMQTVITPDARVWTCVNKRGYPGAALGDLHEESFSEIWKRRGGCRVDGACRVMCRGHIPNLQLDAMAQPRDHAAFI